MEQPGGTNKTYKHPNETEKNGNHPAKLSGTDHSDDLTKIRIVNKEFTAVILYQKSYPFDLKKYCILNEFVFKSDEHDHAEEQTYQTQFSPFYNQIFFKKIFSIEKDKKYNVWIYNLIDRYMLDNVSYQSSQTNMLAQQNKSEETKKLAKLLENYKDNLTEISMGVKRYNLNGALDKSSFQKVFLNQDYDIGNFFRKYSYRIHEDASQELLKYYPFFCLVYSYPLSSCNSRLAYFSHNKLLLDLVQLSNVHLDGIKEGFEILSYIHSDNWVSLYQKMATMYLDKEAKKCKQEPSELYIKCKNGQLVPGHFILYKNMYFESNLQLRQEIYFFYQGSLEGIFTTIISPSLEKSLGFKI